MQPEPSTQSTSDYALDMSPGEKPLQSWKEIAAYMERDVRTARRWEQAEGLPVRRHRGGSRSSVYAYPSEIEAWRAARKPRADTDAAVPVWKRFGPRLAITASVFMAALAVLRGPILNPSDPVAEAAKAGGVQLNQVWTGPKVDFHRSVSADGRYVSYVDSKADSGPNLALHDLLEDKDRLLTHNNFEETPGFPVYSVISPDGKQVAYTWRNNETRIHELRIVSTTGKSGTDPQLVYTNTETPDLRPQAWFPDGRRILAQIGTKDKTNQIVVISLDDGSLEVIKSLEWRWPQNLGLSPDGRHIVYDAAPNQDSPQRDIYLLAVDGSREISLIKHSADEAWADWSPDGGHIFFTSDRTGTASLWSIAMSGIQPNGPAQLIKRDLGFDRVLTGGLTTSGSLYFEANSSTRDLFIAELDWRTGKTIAEPAKIAVRVEGANSEPQWSPDGSRLAYLARNPHRRSPSSFGLVIHTLTTGEEQTLDLGIELEGERPHWSPDGTLIMIAGADGRRRSLYGIDPQSGSRGMHFTPDYPTSCGWPVRLPRRCWTISE